MIPAVVQTLANILAGGTSLGSLEQISFNLPSTSPVMDRGLCLYFYDIQKADRKLHEDRHSKHGLNCQNLSVGKEKDSIIWFDISFLVSAHDQTALGTQQLLSEALTVVLQHNLLQEELLVPALRGYGNLPLTVKQPTDTAALWRALGVPLRPAFFVSLTVPWCVQQDRTHQVSTPSKTGSSATSSRS